MICLMSRKENCWDNAPSERFFYSLKHERMRGLLFDCIEPFYNQMWQHSTLGYASPMKFLEDWISTQYEQQLVA